MKIGRFNIPFTHARVNEQKPVEINALLDQILKHPDNKEFKNLLKKAAHKDPVNVFMNIIRYQHSQYRKEVETWKVARAEAMDIYNPRRVMLTDLYEDIELDGFIHGIVHNKRIFKISNKPFKIIGPDGKERPEKTALFKHEWFNDFLKMAMQSRFYGYTLAYFYEWNAKGQICKTELIPRRHVIPDRHVWVASQYDQLGYDYTQPPYSQYMLGIGKEKDLGLYEKAALLYILKKHSWQSWDELEERFGIPIPIVETASQDKKVLDLIEKWLRDLSTGSYGIVPDGGKLTVVETGKTDTWQIFFRKIEMAQNELEVLFTGQIRETNKNGTYGKEAIKEEEAQELVEDDKTFIYNLINDALIPQILIPNGYPLEEGERFDWNDGKKQSPKERLEIFQGVKLLGFKLDQNQVSEQLDVIITGEAVPVVPADPQPDPEKEPEETKPKNAYEELMRMHSTIIKDIFQHVH